MPVEYWSPELLRTGQKIPRSVVLIPRDQQKLLDRSDAWSRQGIPNVPTEILEEARESHVENKTSPLLNQSPRKDEEASDDSDAESAISWEPSPTQHRVAPGRAKFPETLAGRTTSAASPGLAKNRLAAESEPESASVHAQAQAPALGSKQKPEIRRNVLIDPPMSSLASADEVLEVEVPKAIAAPLVTVNKEACHIPLEPTPPSAQIIPSTYTEPSAYTAPVQQTPGEPQPKRQRLMKAFRSIASDGPKPVHQPPSFVVTESPSVTVQPTVGPNSSTEISSKSVEDAAILPSVAPVRNAPVIHDNAEQGHSSSYEKIPPNGPASQVPYTAFKLAYPDFQAEKNDFLRALLSLKHIKKNKSIPRFCYDDFVRVFCGDYLKYITLDTGDQETLTAAKWYNCHVETPVYLKGLLTPENLQEALDQYPNEAASLSNQLSRRVEPPKVVIAKPTIAMPSEPETPVPDKRITQTPTTLSAIVSATVPTIPGENPGENPQRSHLELVSDPIDPVAPAAKPLSAQAPSVSNIISPPSRTPEFVPPSPSVKETGDMTSCRQEERGISSSSRKPPAPAIFKVPPLPAPPPPPRQILRASDHQRQEAPVAAYARKHSLRADELQDTGVPLSQQSTAETTDQPKSKKPRSKKKRRVQQTENTHSEQKTEQNRLDRDIFDVPLDEYEGWLQTQTLNSQPVPSSSRPG